MEWLLPSIIKLLNSQTLINQAGLMAITPSVKTIICSVAIRSVPIRIRLCYAPRLDIFSITWFVSSGASGPSDVLEDEGELASESICGGAGGGGAGGWWCW